jgi:hypothetical protein
MAADDSSDTGYNVSTSSATDSTSDAPVLEAHVRSWLEARLGSATRDVTVAVHAMPGRWLFRVECGAVASTIEHPTRRNDCASVDLATAVRRFAMRVGHAARIETPHGHEVRVNVVPAAASRS